MYKNIEFDDFLKCIFKLSNFYEKEIVKRDETIEEIYETNVLLKKQIELYKQEDNGTVREESMQNETDKELIGDKECNKKDKYCLKLLNKIKKIVEKNS